MSTEDPAAPAPLGRRAFLGAAAGAAAATAMPAMGAETHGDAPQAAWYGADDPQVPRVGLRWVFSASVFFADRIVIGEGVIRGCTSVGGGEVWGPRLTGRVLPHSGADYFKGTLPGGPHNGANGFSTYYMLEAADGALIFIHNRGSMRRFKGPAVPGKPLVPATAQDAPEQLITRFRATPVFTAPLGPHDWMNHTVFVAHAQRQSNPDHTVFTYYEVL
jgi:hypothetical protein